MWADTFLQAEQQHLLRLLLWSGLSIVAATAVAVLLVARNVRSALLKHFAVQTGVWGVAIGLIATVEWRSLHLRDLSGMTRVERVLWLSLGLDIGFVAIGIAVALTAWLLARRMAFIGAGTAIIVQGMALLVIDLQFAALVSR